jgi:phage-related protein
MLNETFYLDGVDARSVGICLQRPIEFSEPVPVCEIESIPGRSGDLIFETGAFENRTGSASCFALNPCGVERTIRSINKYLFSKRGYRKLETSNDPDHYWLARVENGARIEQRMRVLAPFELSFDCKPQRFLRSGLSAIVVSENIELNNMYGFPARPLIAVYGQGVGSLLIGEKQVTINYIDGVLYLDSETQNAYNNVGYQNSSISATEFPVIEPGKNEIYFSGAIDRIEIIPRWWEL